MQQLLFAAAIYLGIAVAMLVVVRRLRLPRVLGYLCAGILAGPVLGLVGSEAEDIQHFAEFGIVLALFAFGTRFDLRSALTSVATYGSTAAAQWVATAAVLALGAFAAGLTWQACVVIGAALAFSSSALMAGPNRDRAPLSPQASRAVFSATLVQWLGLILAIALVPLLVPFRALSPEGTVPLRSAPAADEASGLLVEGLSVPVTLAVAAAVLLAVPVLHRWILSPLLRYTAARRDRELFYFAVLGHVFLLSALAMVAGISPILPVVIAGLLIGGSSHRDDIAATMTPLGNLLVGLFVFAVGASIDVRYLLNVPLSVLGLAAAMMTVRAGVLWFFARRQDFDARGRREYLLTLLPPGEFGLVLASLAAQLSVLPPTVAEAVQLLIALGLLMGSAFGTRRQPDATSARPPRPLRVFLSYSRRDAALSRMIGDRLAASGHDLLVDSRSLPFGHRWKVELMRLLRECDVVVLLVSPAMVASEWCRWEVRQARQYGKRVVPVRIAEVAAADLPAELAEIQLLPSSGLFDVGDRGHRAMLNGAIGNNDHWIRDKTRYLEAAMEWAGSGRNADLLLSPTAASAAREWLESRPATEDPPGLALTEYLEASFAAASEQSEQALPAG